MNVICEKCRREIPGEDSFQHLGQTLCEDCYFDARKPNRACDPWAVYNASRNLERSGTGKTDNLTGLQQQIYRYVKDNGRVTPQQVAAEFGLAPSDLENQFATLRHCELLKGRKDGDTVYLVPFSS